MCCFNDRLYHSQYNGLSAVRIFHTVCIRSLPATRCISRQTQQPHGVRRTCPHLTTPVPHILCISTQGSTWPITPYLTPFPKPPLCYRGRPYNGTDIVRLPHSYFVFNGVLCHRVAFRSLNLHHWLAMVCQTAIMCGAWHTQTVCIHHAASLIAASKLPLSDTMFKFWLHVSCINRRCKDNYRTTNMLLQWFRKRL